MKYNRSSVAVFIVVLCLSLCRADRPVLGEDGWELVKNKDGIAVYLRSAASSGIKECKGVMTVEGVTLSSLLSVLDDTGSYTRWMYKCYEAKLLEKVGLYERVTYLAQKFPFGLKDRDLVNRSLVSQDPSTKAVTIRVTGEPSFIPPVPGRMRIQVLAGHWMFRPLKAGFVEVEYLIHMDPGGSIPAWMVNIGLPAAPFETLSQMRKMVRLEKYRSARISQVKEPQQPL